MEARVAPSFTSSADAVSTTCRIVVSYDWSSTRYFLPDHLNSTNVVTDASGTVIQVLDYYPYGSTRISQTTGGFNEGKQFIAQYSDPETNLSYLQQRYMDGSKGDFLSEDPSFLAVGTPKLTEILNRVNGGKKQDDRQALQGLLSDPQMMNSYGYGRDNPISSSDPTGEWGVFYGPSVGGDAGLAEGFSGSFQSAGGFTAGNSLSSPVDFGSITSYGGLVGGPFQSVTTEGVKGINNSNYAVFGFGGGPGRQATITNATRISDLKGPGISWNVVLGILTVSWSRSTDNKIWTVSVGLGKPGLTFSTYPTVTGSYTAKTIGNGASPGNTHTACGTLCQ